MKLKTEILWLWKKKFLHKFATNSTWYQNTVKRCVKTQYSLSPSLELQNQHIEGKAGNRLAQKNGITGRNDVAEGWVRIMFLPSHRPSIWWNFVTYTINYMKFTKLIFCHRINFVSRNIRVLQVVQLIFRSLCGEKFPSTKLHVWWYIKYDLVYFILYLLIYLKKKKWQDLLPIQYSKCTFVTK